MKIHPMKKCITFLIITTMLLSLCSVAVQADEAKYPTSPILEEYLSESIDNYFLPQGYDVRWCFETTDGLEYFLNNAISETVTVPFVVTCGKAEKYPDAPVIIYKDAFEELGIVMTDDMKRTLYLNNESAIRSFVAPWTLYNANTGELYTWPELMAMSDDEINALDFENPDFVVFITNVKSELEKRGWWKEEYQARYQLLNSHKDDYSKTLDIDDNFVIDGVTYNFATLDYQFKTKVNQTVQNITCVNIHSREFKTVYNGLSDVVKNKYKELIQAIEATYESTPSAIPYYGPVWGQPYMHLLIDHINSLSDDEKKEIQDKSNFELFEAYFNYGVSEEDIRTAAVEYNYVAAPWAKFESSLLDEFFSAETKHQALNVFESKIGLLVDAENFQFIPMVQLRNKTPYRFEITDKERINELITDIKEKIHYSDMSYDEVEDDIAYLESLLESNPPQTGENTFFYIVISASALVCMTALLARKRKPAV